MKTFFRHFRNFNDNNSILNFGGETLAFQYNIDTGDFRMGIAICSPKDNFNKKIGRKISEGRMMKESFSKITPEFFEVLISRSLE